MTFPTAANLAMPVGRRRCPILSKGQIARVLLFWLAVTATILMMDHGRSRTAEAGPFAAAAAHQARAKPEPIRSSRV